MLTNKMQLVKNMRENSWAIWVWAELSSTELGRDWESHSESLESQS